MSGTVLHVSGFVHDSRPTEVKVTSYEGRLDVVANGVLGQINHPMKTETVRTLDGLLKEVHAYIDVDGTEMWHVFTSRTEPWPITSLQNGEER